MSPDTIPPAPVDRHRVPLTRLYLIAAASVIALIVTGLILAIVYVGSLNHRLAADAAAGCNRNGTRSAINARGWRMAAAEARGDGALIVAGKYDALADELDELAAINCKDAFHAEVEIQAPTTALAVRVAP